MPPEALQLNTSVLLESIYHLVNKPNLASLRRTQHAEIETLNVRTTLCGTGQLPANMQPGCKPAVTQLTLQKSSNTQLSPVHLNRILSGSNAEF